MEQFIPELAATLVQEGQTVNSRRVVQTLAEQKPVERHARQARQAKPVQPQYRLAIQA